MADDKRPVILAVSFGTSYEDTRSITIGAIENALAERNPEYEVRRAFTSNIIRKKLLERDGIKTDSVPEALEKLVAEGVRKVVVMPTHMMEGEEFDNKIVSEAKRYEDRFEDMRIGHALLTEDRDFRHMAAVLDRITAPFAVEDTARVFMGHGTEHKANEVYARLQKAIESRGIGNMFIGTVEAEPTLEDMVRLVKERGFKKVLLSPLMIVAGDHATNDMAGDDEDSWKNTFEKAGLKVSCRVAGLGSDWRIQRMIAYHCKKAIEG